MRARFVWVLTLVVVMLASFATGAPSMATHTGTQTPKNTATSGGPLPPAQPETGPGSDEMLFNRVVATHYGDETYGYWIFEPADPVDGASLPNTDEPMPLVLLLSGCLCGSEDDVEPYVSCPIECHQSWIDHLVQRGNIVIYPLYGPDHPDEHISAAVHSALEEFAKGGHARADLGHFALFGWSFGGTMAANYLATAAAAGLPVPQAMMIFGPGCDECALADFSTAPATTRILVIVSTEDGMVTEDRAKAIWSGLQQVPADHRNYIRMSWDRHGSPPLVADHTAPATDTEWAVLDSLDWYGFWKPFDALMSCTFANQDCEFVFGDTPEVRFMGMWSDGVPAVELDVVADPGPPAS